MWLGGCASTPDSIRTSDEPMTSLAAVRASPDKFDSAQVRWGGVVMSVENRANDTLLQIVDRRLDGRGRPRQQLQSAGRFIARVDGFLDPAVYAVQRSITVVGTVDGALNRKIGEADYQFPVVAVEKHHLWDPGYASAPHSSHGHGPYHGYRHSHHHSFFDHDPFDHWWYGNHHRHTHHGNHGYLNINWILSR